MTSSSGLGICATCGAPGAPCCDGRVCNGGGCCFYGVCIADGATCVTSNSTTTYGQCQNGRCPCGNADEPCCEGLPNTGGCSSFELICDSVGANATGLCKPCGKRNGPCCLLETCTEAGTSCIASDRSSRPSCQ
jgi:hypothetical protein